MIKVNLIGTGTKKQTRTAVKVSVPVGAMPVVLLLIVLGFAGSGYWWHSTLSAQSSNLDAQIGMLEARKAALEAVIKLDQVFEARKKMLETRVKVVEGLQKNQVSPVVALDQLAEAVEKTQFVWLSSLDQNDRMLSMSGVGTSLNAIADFYTNLNATGYFKNVDLGPSQESSGNFTFSLKCEFSPPRNVVTNPQPAPLPAGGN
jgi:Tfp pilus assembly protein PilN